MYTFFCSFFPSNRHVDKIVNVLPRELTHWSLRTWHSSWLAKFGLWPPNTSLESFGTAIINYWKQKKKLCNFSDKIKITTRKYFILPKGPSCNSQATCNAFPVVTCQLLLIQQRGQTGTGRGESRMIMGLWILALPISACSFIVGKRFPFISPTHCGETAAAAALCWSQEGGWMRGKVGRAGRGRKAEGSGRAALPLWAEGARALACFFSAAIQCCAGR